MRPWWMYSLPTFLGSHIFDSTAKQHVAAVQALQQACASLLDMARAADQQRQQQQGAPVPAPAFLAGCLQAEAEHKLTQEQLLQLVLEMVLAGTDTSSVTMYYLQLQLQDDPSLEDMLVQEAQDIAGGQPST